jgi:RNA polymerase sigma-70 factor, ECF subfamily
MARLEQVDERKARVVELRVFGGLDATEIGAALGVSRETVQRDWRFASACLARELSSRAAVSAYLN